MNQDPHEFADEVNPYRSPAASAELLAAGERDVDDDPADIAEVPLSQRHAYCGSWLYVLALTTLYQVVVYSLPFVGVLNSFDPIDPADFAGMFACANASVSIVYAFVILPGSFLVCLTAVRKPVYYSTLGPHGKLVRWGLAWKIVAWICLTLTGTLVAILATVMILFVTCLAVFSLG